MDTKQYKRWNGEHCHNCGRPYTSIHHVPDWLWEKISPRSGGGGLLCIPCIDYLARQHGVSIAWDAQTGRTEPSLDVHVTDLGGQEDWEFPCSGEGCDRSFLVHIDGCLPREDIREQALREADEAGWVVSREKKENYCENCK